MDHPQRPVGTSEWCHSAPEPVARPLMHLLPPPPRTCSQGRLSGAQCAHPSSSVVTQTGIRSGGSERREGTRAHAQPDSSKRPRPLLLRLGAPGRAADLALIALAIGMAFVLAL